MNQEGKTCGFEAFPENCSRACFLITLSLSLMQCACWFDTGLGTSLAHGLLHSETATLHLYSPMRPGMCTAVGSVDKMWACQLPIPLRRQPPAALLAGLCIPPCVFDQEHKHHKHRHTQARLFLVHLFVFEHAHRLPEQHTGTGIWFLRALARA